MTFSPFLAPERDDAARLGRPKRSGETYYCVPGVGWVDSGSVGGVAGADFYEPWYTPTPLVIDQLASEVTTALAATNFRIGFYHADGDWQPIGPPLADSGNLSSASTGVKTYTPGTPIYVPRGRYLSVRNCDSATPFFRTYRGILANQGLDSALGTSGILNFRVTRAYAAFPTPGTAWTVEDNTSSAAWFHVFYRITTP